MTVLMIVSEFEDLLVVDRPPPNCLVIPSFYRVVFHFSSTISVMLFSRTISPSSDVLICYVYWCCCSILVFILMISITAHMTNTHCQIKIGKYKGVDLTNFFRPSIQSVKIKACVLYSYKASLNAHYCFNE
jgi:hypothetical protein